MRCPPGAGLARPMPRLVAVAALTMLGSKAPSKSVAVNRLARRNYEILQEYQAGISLQGTEIKSCRHGKMNLRDGYCQVKDGECWLQNVHIAAHESTGRYFQHDETRSRRLLLHKSEIRKLDAEVSRKGLTIVPLKAYFTDGGRLKVQIGLARGKQLHDKRETIRRREIDRDTSRAIKSMPLG